MYRFIFALSLVTGCTIDSQVTTTVSKTVENTVTNTITETVIVEVSEEVGTYHVPANNQVYETNTRLEFVDGYQLTLPSSAPDISSDLDCMVANLRTPEDAGQGVILERIEWGAIANGWESNGWENHISTVGYGSNVEVLGKLQIFWDPNDLTGSELVYDVWPFDAWWQGLGYYEVPIGFATEPHFYVPAGGTVSIGFCSAWEQGQNPQEAPTESWMWFHSVLGRISWTPADTQNFTSEAIDGLALPVTSATFPNVP